jgi:hypothetical protein
MESENSNEGYCLNNQSKRQLEEPNDAVQRYWEYYFIISGWLKIKITVRNPTARRKAAVTVSAFLLNALEDGFSTFPRTLSSLLCSCCESNYLSIKTLKTIPVTLSMAPKRPPPVEDPPPASISEEEEEEDSSSAEEEEEEEEEEQQQSDGEQGHPSPPQPQNKTQNPPHKITETTTQQSESDSESESASESEPDQIVKPITSKPMEETPPKAASAASKKPRSKPATAATPEKTTALKRGNETHREDSKRAKNKEPEPEKPEDSKKQLFQRLWTEDDEIALLRGIIDFTAKKGYDPSKDMNAFYDFIKKSLHFDVSMTQLKDKISRLKKKFENHVKGKKGENKIFSKPHDQKGFDLSKSIWGSDGSIKANGRKNDSGNTSNNNKTGNAKKPEASKPELGMDVGEEDRVEVEMGRGSSVKSVLKFDSDVSVERMEDYVVRMGLNFVHGTEKEKMEEEWRKLHVAELELFLKRNELIREQAKLMLTAFKAEKD